MRDAFDEMGEAALAGAIDEIGPAATIACDRPDDNQGA
jgi:hypothetical protein